VLNRRTLHDRRQRHRGLAIRRPRQDDRGGDGGGNRQRHYKRAAPCEALWRRRRGRGDQAYLLAEMLGCGGACAPQLGDEVTLRH
jgi:hypothetical protein